MLNVKNLSYKFNMPLPIQVLWDITFKVESGEIVAVLGVGGSGKSTLFRCLAGIYRISDGFFDGFERCGLVVQNPEQQFFLQDVCSEVAWAINNLNSEQCQAEVAAILDDVGYNGSPENSPFDLSSGEQRMVALAGVLINKPDLLLLDEPTVGLDGRGQHRLREILKACLIQNKTILISGHDLDFLYEVAERFIVLDQGRLIADFPREKWLDQAELLQKKGVGIPEKVALELKGFPSDVLQVKR